MIGDIGDPAEYGQFDDRVRRRAAAPAFGVRIVVDRAECERTALWSARIERGARVDGGQPDAVVIAGDKAGGIDGEDVMGSTSVAPGIEQLIQALRMQPEEHAVVERIQPLLHAHVAQDLLQDVRPERCLVADYDCAEQWVRNRQGAGARTAQDLRLLGGTECRG